MLTRRAPARDAGFTLIELLVTIVISGAVSLAFANVLIGYLRNADTTTSRLTQSHDVQLAAMYFADDVAAMGYRSVSGSQVSALSGGVSTGAAVTCASYPASVVALTWTDFAHGPDGSSSPDTITAYYSLQGSDLYRIVCRNGSEQVGTAAAVAHDVQSASVCSPSCPASTASSVTLTLSLADSHQTSSVTLTGTRRQNS